MLYKNSWEISSNMKKIFILISILFTLLFTFSCTSEKKNTGIIVMGTSPAFPPFEYILESGEEIIGFDIELAKEIAENLNKTLVIKSTNFNDLISLLENDDIDMIISGMTITDERKNNIDFSIPYYEASQVVLKRADDNTFTNITTKESLGENKNIGSQLGTTGSTIAHQISKNDFVTDFKSCELVVQGLLNEEVDVIIIDKEPAKSFMSKYGNLAILPIKFETEHYGIGIKKGNYELLDSVNKTIHELVNSGKYIQFVDEYINSYSAG